jgi:hypothetical protein
MRIERLDLNLELLLSYPIARRDTAHPPPPLSDPTNAIVLLRPPADRGFFNRSSS